MIRIKWPYINNLAGEEDPVASATGIIVPRGLSVHLDDLSFPKTTVSCIRYTLMREEQARVQKSVTNILHSSTVSESHLQHHA